MNYIQENYEQIVAIATGVVTVCSLIAALTPTPKDDGVVKWLYKLVDLMAINIGKAKEK